MAQASKERAALERLFVLEGTISDVASASSNSLAATQAKIDRGLQEVHVAVSAARSGTEAREAQMREQINAALAKVAKYAKDMECTLEADRARLEVSVLLPPCLV